MQIVFIWSYIQIHMFVALFWTNLFALLLAMFVCLYVYVCVSNHYFNYHTHVTLLFTLGCWISQDRSHISILYRHNFPIYVPIMTFIMSERIYQKRKFLIKFIEVSSGAMSTILHYKNTHHRDQSTIFFCLCLGVNKVCYVYWKLCLVLKF